MFQFIYFNVFEIFVATTVVLVVVVLFFATRHRNKLNAAERAGETRDTDSDD